MKKLLALLLLSPLVYSDETTVKYCMDKYDPIELSKEFGQCVNDIKGASRLSEPKDLRNKEIKSDINTTEKAYIYKGLYESKPLPRAQIINDPFSKICSVYKKNNIKQSKYKGRNLGSGSIQCYGDTLDASIKHCLDICIDRINVDIALKRDAERIQKQQAANYINSKQELCEAFGFFGVNAIASCVQEEIKSELERLQNLQNYANSQAKANAQSRSRAMSSYSRCLSTAGETFGSCANAWNGYTPPKVTVCEYDAFGNKITATCREQ